VPEAALTAGHLDGGSVIANMGHGWRGRPATVSPSDRPGRGALVDIKGSRSPAMTDVARLAGVSHQTVSRVLNDHPNVKEQTRLRVRAAIAELGYRPNKAARALVTGKSQLIGVVAQNSTLFGPASLLAAFEQAAAEAGFAVSVGSVGRLDRESIAGAVERHLDQRVAGLAVIAPVASASEALDEMPAGVPLVAVDGDPQRSDALVTVDQFAGARAATQHLLDAGHRTVWHVSGPPDWYDAAGRIQGWRQALEEAGAEVPPPMPADWSAAAGYRAGQLLARMPEVTAVFTANDHLALGILRALHERGRRVPHDISVVGFDDVPEAAFFIPPLTTVRPPFDAVARAGLDLLLAQIVDEAPEAGRVVLAPELIVRDSVAPPAGARRRP
jgi:DNA-binding LacI/PurR family transcriptional regulator